MTTAPTRESHQLILQNQGLVKSLAWKIHRQLPAHVDIEDLIGYGQLGLAEAAGEFDPSRGCQFSTYAYHRVRGAILDGLAAMSWFNRAAFAAGRYQQTSRSIGQLDGEDATANDIADPTIGPQDGILRDEAIAWVTDSLEDLMEPARELLRACYFEGLNLSQAGRRLGYSRAWACREHRRALNELAQVLSGPLGS